jgi:competence protein ComEC
MLQYMKGKVSSLQKVLQNYSTEYGKVFAVGILSSIIAILFVLLFREGTSKALFVSFLDVGQGDAVLVETPSGHHVLIDGGPDDKILSLLSEKLSYFDHHLDMIVATHADADHVTGLIPVLARYDVDTIMMTSLGSETSIYQELLLKSNEEGAKIIHPKKYDVVTFGDGVSMTVLYPDEPLPPHLDTNDASIVTLLKYGSSTVLLTGDLPSTHEHELIADGILEKEITIFKAGHHGSKTSSGEELLSYSRPEYTVISAGKNNRYGHPHKETLDRLIQYSKAILSTIDLGTITFSLDGIHAHYTTDR